MKKRILILMFAILGAFVFSSCTENYSTGEKIGVITSFQKQGYKWASWEGHLNITQTGMNSSTGFDFSIDNDKEDPIVIKTLDSAQKLGWKVNLKYHQVKGWNWFSNRGHTNIFVSGVDVVERNFGNVFNGSSQAKQVGKTVDTVYVVIVDKSRLK